VIVVSDASVVINLSRIGRLGLLREIYGRVVVPLAVAGEVERGAAGLLAAEASWIEVTSIKRRGLVDELAEGLDPGECEAIALAVEMRADFLLIDENLGRAAALRLGLRITGLLGVLLVAKQRHLIVAVAPNIRALVAEVFWLSDEVIARVLRQAGE
jgi:predicted nucleic acid-binding protein